MQDVWVLNEAGNTFACATATFRGHDVKLAAEAARVSERGWGGGEEGGAGKGGESRALLQARREGGDVLRP